MATPKMPSRLNAPGQRLWTDTLAKYVLRTDELMVLEAACREADLIGRIERQLVKESLTTSGSMGQTVAHPLLGEVRQHRAALASLLRALKLPDEDAASGPAVNAQRKGGESRWAQAHGKAS